MRSIGKGRYCCRSRRGGQHRCSGGCRTAICSAVHPVLSRARTVPNFAHSTRDRNTASGTAATWTLRFSDAAATAAAYAAVRHVRPRPSRAVASDGCASSRSKTPAQAFLVAAAHRREFPTTTPSPRDADAAFAIRRCSSSPSSSSSSPSSSRIIASPPPASACRLLLFSGSCRRCRSRLVVLRPHDVDSLRRIICSASSSSSPFPPRFISPVFDAAADAFISCPCTVAENNNNNKYSILYCNVSDDIAKQSGKIAGHEGREEQRRCRYFGCQLSGFVPCWLRCGFDFFLGRRFVWMYREASRCNGLCTMIRNIVALCLIVTHSDRN